MEQNRRRLVSSAGKDINGLPPEIIGAILSCLACVRDVAMASMTCRTLRHVVKHYLQKITCRFSEEQRKWKNYELLINGVVMQTRCLRELSIYNGRIRACSLSLWLRHTRKTLKSFTLFSKTRTHVCVLEKIARSGVGLECFVWQDPVVPALKAITCCFSSLKSLTLDKIWRGFDSADKIQHLFSLFPKLETLSLREVIIREAPPRIVLNIPSTLTTLSMKMLEFNRKHSDDPKDIILVVSSDNLVCLSLVNFATNSQGGVWVILEQEKCFRDLTIQEVNITRLKFSDSLEHLAIWHAHIKHLEVKDLRFLLDLTLFTVEGSRPIWPTYSKIIRRANRKLSKLRLLGGLPTFTAEDLDTVASLFPRLQWLSLYHQTTLFGKSPRKLQPFLELFVLELYVNNKVTDHDLFCGWILKLVECCPNMKRLAIKLEPRPALSWTEETEFPGKLAALLKKCVSPYPRIVVTLDTVDSELLRIFSRNPS